MNNALIFYDLSGHDFANLYAFQYHAHEKNIPSLNIYKRINISSYRDVLAILRHTFIY